MDETKELFHADNFQMFLYSDTVMVWNKFFPTFPIDTSRVINALLLSPVKEAHENQILVEFTDFTTVCWDLVPMTISVAYQILQGQKPVHPRTGKQFTVSTVALIGYAYSLIENPEFGIPKPDLDKIFRTMTAHPVFDDIKTALDDADTFFTEKICELYADEIVCEHPALKKFINKEQYNQDLWDKIKLIKLSVDARDRVAKSWDAVTALAIDKYWGNRKYDTTMIEAVVIIMEWLGSQVLSDSVCPGSQGTGRNELLTLEEMPTLVEAMNHCTLSLIMEYIFKYKPNKTMLHTIGLGAFVLAYKALALDDTKGCLPTVRISNLVNVCPTRCDEEQLKNIERQMYALVDHIPCKKQFQKYRLVE